MKPIFTIIFICFVSIWKLPAQSGNPDPIDAENLFENKRFASVWPYYMDLLKKDSSNSDLNYKMGMCYLNSRSQKAKAVNCFKKVIGSSVKETNASVNAYRLLAEAAYATSNFDLAVENYDKYKKALLETKGSSQPVIDEATRKIELCKISKELKEMKELVATLISHKFSSPDKNSTTPTLDYSTSISPDQSTLIFKFKRRGRLDQINSDNEYFEELDVLSPIETVQAKIPDTSTVKKEATVATSVDGQIMLIYKDDNGVANIYTSFLDGNDWTTPEILDKSINTKGWEADEFLSADGNELYFTSSREGGFGGKDIYKSTKLPNGEWSKAVNLGPKINSSFDEQAPFVHPDGATLFFSSNRYKKKGTYDVFTSTLSDSGWKEPISVGYPEHKNGIEPSGTVKQSKDRNKNKNDNCTVTFINQKKTPLTLVKGKIVDADGKIPRYIEITVRNIETGEIAGIYHCNSKTGQYQFIAPPGKNNHVVFEAAGYLFHTENVDISKETDFYKAGHTIALVPLAAGSKDVLNNIFFENSKAVLLPASHVELDKVFDFLTLNPKASIEISGYASKTDPAFDSKLFEAKIQSIIDYLTDKGIHKERLASNVYNFETKKKRKKRKEANAEEIAAGKIQIKVLEIN